MIELATINITESLSPTPLGHVAGTSSWRLFSKGDVAFDTSATLTVRNGTNISNLARMTRESLSSVSIFG